MSLWKNRIAAVAVGSLVIVGVGATGAGAAKLITSAQIKNNTIQSVDVRNGSLTGKDIKNSSLTGSDIKNGSIALSDLSAAAQQALKGTPATPAPAAPEGISGLQAESLGAPTPITNIGGSITERFTNLGVELELPAGKYLISIDGSFESASDSATPAIEIYPQLSLWIDRNEDGKFNWNANPALNEGGISPNAIMPIAKKRHISVNGSQVLELDEAQTVQVVGFGYASDESAKRSGEINVTAATLTATPIN